MSSSDRTVKRQQIEDSTAARLAEIVAAAEQAAKQVIDEAEAEARARLSDAHEEADRIVAERLAGLSALIDEIGAQAEALKRGAEALQAALARARIEAGGTEAFGGTTAMRRPEAAPDFEEKPAGPSLTVVGIPGGEAEPPSAPEPEPDAAVSTPAGARLLATQMAVSGSSREEIEARLRSGFAIADTRPILDAILGPEK